MFRVLLLGGKITKRNIGAFSRKGDGRCRADTGVAACYQGLATGQATGAAIGLLPVIGMRHQVRIQSGKLL